MTCENSDYESYCQSHLIEVIHEHLAHLVDRDGGIDSAVEAELPHSVWQSSQMEGIRMRQEDSIHLMDISAEHRHGLLIRRSQSVIT